MNRIHKSRQRCLYTDVNDRGRDAHGGSRDPRHSIWGDDGNHARGIPLLQAGHLRPVQRAQHLLPHRVPH